MNPLRIQIENFMSHKHSDIDCRNFRSALIIAKNLKNERESNGIGKTTVLSAIDFALFGEVPTSTLDMVVRDGAKKCLVTYDFETVNGTYRVVRGRSSSGKSELRLYKSIGDDDWESITQRSMPETTAKLQEIIKINYKAFGLIKYAQADFSGLAAADKGLKRKAMLKEPLQLAPYTRLEKILEPKFKDIKKSIERKDAAIQTLGEPKSEINAAKSEIEFCKTNIKSKEDDIQRLESTLIQKQTMLTELKSSLSSSDSDLHENISNLERQEKSIKQSLRTSLEIVNENEQTIEQAKKECSKLRDKLINLNTKLDELKNKKIGNSKDTNAILEKVSQDEIHGNKLISRLEALYDQANKNLPNGDICPSCHQAITPEHRKQCELEVNKQLESLSEQLRTTKANLTKCQNKKKRVQKELKDITEHERTLFGLNHEIESITSQIDIRTKNLENAEKQLVQATSDMKKYQEQYNNVNARLSSLKESAQNTPNVSELNNKIFAISDEIKVFEKGKEKVQQDLADLRAKIGVLNERIRIGNENLDKLEQFKSELADLHEELNVHQLVAQAFSPNGIPTYIIYSILDELQVETNDWLDKLRPELRLRFDKDLEIYYSVNNADRDYSQLSIGQKVYISLALKLGLSTIIQNKLGIDIRFLELDEVDAPLDEAGVDALIDVIKKLESSFKIFFVTHNPNLKSRFNHAILVEGDGENGSTASVVTTW